MSLITGYLVLIGILGLTRLDSHRAALSGTASGLLEVCGVEVVVFGLIYGLAWYASRASADELRLRWRGGIPAAVWGMLYSVALRLGVALVVGVVGCALVITHVFTFDEFGRFMLGHKPDVEALVDVQAMGNNPVYFWMTLTVASFVVAGLREELWRSAFLAGMRGVWPQYFGGFWGQMAAVVAGAVVFGAAHLAMGWLAAVMAGLLGIGLGVIMVAHRAIWPAVIAHGCFDATSFALIPWALKSMHHLPT